MKKIFEKARTWISVRRAESRARQKATARRELERESEKVIQVREFGGEVYLCYGAVPVMPADGLSWDLPTAVAVARATYVSYAEHDRSEV